MKKNKAGRPGDYTQALGDLICERIATHSIGLQRLCDLYHDMPEKSTIRRWYLKYTQFRTQYAQAKALQVETLIDEIIDIADDASQDIDSSEKGRKFVIVNLLLDLD
ncbi:hypothetical protein B1207_02905 [Legionella quinlivanii]|uniref:Uncharacterized protein n=1 Tax=Legionella quinlivanii TaxID=45073 RepID=A0A364LM53_9GAMM|nr:hypothetical protein [Legionella quinlivanii]RAP37953.1 hypothetical protein B1207_02905 [Legionella quinlivanii]